MQTEKQRERLVELINKSGVSFCNFAVGNYEEEAKTKLADYLMSNNVVVLPENALVEVKPRIVYEDKASAIVEEEYVITWENKRTLLKAKEKPNENHTMRND